MELLLTGAPIDAPTALAWGLVNRVVPAAALDAEIGRFTGVILARSAATIAMGKAAFYRQIEQPLDAAYDMTAETMACNMGIDDAAEGIDAFLQKRTPVWRGR
jgi:enoyl-CoA hydratase/carnithine racemase